MPDFTRSILLASPDDTARLAERLAPRLTAGDVILLHGGLGAGKTHFARALIQARLAASGRMEDVPSPTYTLVQAYFDGAVEIWHCDLYRLGGVGDLDELGLEGAFETAICLVEWPERLGDTAPPGALWVRLKDGATDEARKAVLTSENPRWFEVFDDVTADADG